MAKPDINRFARLVTAAQNNNDEAMNSLLTETNDYIYYNCLKILQNENDALDCTQDILLTVYTKLKTLNDPKAYVKWVQLITINRCKNKKVRENKYDLLEPNEEGDDPYSCFENTDEQTVPDKVIDNQETQRMVVELIDALPDEQRICMIMRYYDEMSVKDMAEALNVSEGTVKSRLNYGRKKVKEGVLEYEKQGIKLYSISILPFIAYFLHRNAEQNTISPEQTANMIKAVTGIGAVGGTIAAGAAVGNTIAAGVAAANTISGTAAGAVLAAGTKAIGAKVIAAIVAGVIALSGAGTAAIIHHNNVIREQEEQRRLEEERKERAEEKAKQTAREEAQAAREEAVKAAETQAEERRQEALDRKAAEEAKAEAERKAEEEKRNEENQEKQAAQQTFNIALEYFDGTNDREKDLDEANKDFVEAENSGIAEAGFYVGVIAESKKDYKTAISEYEKAAKSGCGLAYVALGRMYQKGYGAEVDLEAALYYYQRAIDMGYIEGYYGLGELYRFGGEVEQDSEKSVQYYKMAAESENKYWKRLANYSLGYMYCSGTGVTKDLNLAKQYFKIAGDLDFTPAYTMLGRLSRTAGDYKSAISYFMKAANKKDPYAMYNIGTMYSRGAGLKQNSSEALKWYQKAVDCGAEWAKVGIANIYRDSFQHNKALSLYNDVIALCENSRLYSNFVLFGRVGENLPGMTEEARIYSIDWYELIGDTIYWDALGGKGFIYKASLDYNNAFDEFFKCYKLSKYDNIKSAIEGIISHVSADRRTKWQNYKK